MSQTRNAIVLACSLAAASGIAHAEDHAVVHRLSSNGGMSSGHAKQLVAKVNQRLARAADAPPAMADPLRVAVNQAMLGAPAAGDQISAAKVRLKLYAGLNEFMLEAIFAPRRGAIATCVRDVSLTSKECTSLVAAAGRTSVARVKRSAAGPAEAPVAQMAMAAPAPSGGFDAGGGGSRFGGRFNSGFQSAPQQAAPAQYQPVAQSRFQQSAPAQPRFQQQAAPAQYQAQSRFQQPAAQVQQPMAQAQYQQPVRGPVAQAPAQMAQPAARYAAPAAASAPAYIASAPALAASPQDALARREAYKAQREAYLARQKEQFEERRAKTMGAGAASEPEAAAAPAAPAPKPAVVAKAAAPAPEPETPLDADMKAAVPEAATASSAAPSGKAGLDGDFLDGLLDDPLGGKGKKK